MIECAGISIPYVPSIITPKIERPLRKGIYEAREAEAVRRMLRAGDRVLELGSGLGLLSTVAGTVPGVESVTTVEANPGLLPLIRETHRLNGARGVTLLHGVASPEAGPDVDFYLRPDFWGSSLEPESRPFERMVKLSRIDVRQLVEELRPTVLICDIEGGELDLFDAVDLSSVRALVIELHPKVYGRKGMARLETLFRSKGLGPAEGAREGAVQILHRVPEDAPPRQQSGVALVAEVGPDGPWILEWVAWHRAAGVAGIVLFSQGADTATLALLDHLDRRGIVRHLPHPAQVWGIGAEALSYARHLPEVRGAEYWLTLGLDEFLSVRGAECTVKGLLAAAAPFDAISLPRVTHGANGHVAFRPGWVTETHPRHEDEASGNSRCRFLVPASEQLPDWRQAGSELSAGAVWRDGSGLPILPGQGPSAAVRARVDHYPLRDLETFLARHCGDGGTSEGRRAFKAAWREANRNATQDDRVSALQTAARSWMAREMEPDRTLMALHEAACEAHANRLAALALDPVFQSRRKWALSESP